MTKMINKFILQKDEVEKLKGYAIIVGMYFCNKAKHSIFYGTRIAIIESAGPDEYHNFSKNVDLLYFHQDKQSLSSNTTIFFRDNCFVKTYRTYNHLNIGTMNGITIELFNNNRKDMFTSFKIIEKPFLIRDVYRNISALFNINLIQTILSNTLFEPFDQIDHYNTHEPIINYIEKLMDKYKIQESVFKEAV